MVLMSFGTVQTVQVAPSEKDSKKTKKIPPKKISSQKTVALLGILGAFAGIILPAVLPRIILEITGGNTYIPPVAFSFLAGIGMVCALVWAAGAVRRVAKYGLGTGVPSIGMYGAGMSMIIALFALSLHTLWGAVIGFVLAAVTGWTGGWLVNHVIGMKIPAMETRMAEITAGSMLAFYASFILIFGSAETIDMLNYLTGGIIALGFIGCALVIFHSYNAGLGPDEMPDRTRMLTILDGFMLMLVFGIVSFMSKSLTGPLVTIFMSIVFIGMSYHQYWAYVKRDAYSIKEAGLLPAEEEL
ncbi:tetrahydromethanopterin S-methyltransferase subunit MtrC [Methanolapillus ohkumae]|uniref:Tetrahydromethanopterin S-methyltransferase subunit C n=1 Tax=Methanolapillus ohkumae TaxID=3028298 RepID=A0AA96V6P8_9EURY|nr:hypothetical protein MsAm2_15380 [Methanosarcinaceae archaeon Am2]